MRIELAKARIELESVPRGPNSQVAGNSEDESKKMLEAPPRPKKKTMKVINAINEGLNHDEVHEKTGESVENIRTIKRRYRHLIKDNSSEE